MPSDLELIRTSLLSAIQTAIKICAGFVVMKVVAHFAGPAGLALLGQFQNFVTMITNLAGGAFATGVTKYGSQYQSEGKSRDSLYATASRTALVLCLVAAAFIAVADELLSRVLLHDSEYGFVFRLFALLLVFSVLNVLILAALNGERRIKQYIAVNIASSIIMLVGTVILSAFWGVAGALASVALAPALACLFAAVALRREDWLVAALKRNSFRKAELLSVSKFAFISLISALALPVAQVVIREFLVTSYSWHEAGLWQGVARISDVYLLLITATFSVYLLPRLSGMECRDALKAELKRVFSIAMPCAVVLALLVFVFRDLVIWLLFTDDFSGMRDLFGWQLIGDVVKVGAWIFGYVLLARSRLRLFLAGEVVFTASYVLIAIYLTGLFGLQGVVIAHFVNYCLYFAYVFLSVRLSMDHISPKPLANG